MGGSCFYSSVGDAGRVEDFIFLFQMLIKETKEQDVFETLLRGLRDEKILLRSNTSC